MLIDTGAAQVVDGRWEAQPESLQAQKVPGTLVGVLQVTLDALNAPELRCLQQASVVGARFWDEALAALDPGSVEQLPALSRRELTRLQDESAFAGTLEYAFRHHLLHQVTYDTVLKPDRRLAHARAARWLQERGRDREGEVASQIAEHCERAGDTAQAITFWLRAAEEAAQREADVVALRHADRALALDDGTDLRRRLRLHRVRADVHRRQGHADEHAQELDTMESLIDRIDDDVLRLSVAFDRVWRLSLQGRFAELVELALQRLASAPGGAPADAARLHGLLYVGLARLGRKDEAMAHARQGLALARAAGDLVTVGQIHTYVGVLEAEADRIGIALEHHHQAMTAYKEAASRAGMVAVRINLAHAQATVGEIPAARDLLLQAIGECRDTGNRRMEAIAHANIAGLWVEAGEAETGYAAALEGLRLAGLIGETRIAAWAHNSAQYAAHSLARFDLALDHARRAEEGFRVHAVHGAAWINAGAAARNLLALGRVEEARAAAVALLAEVDAQSGWDGAFELAYLLHQVLAPLGHPRAPALLTTAHQLLSTQADRLADQVPRETFLLGTSLHRAICELWDAAQAGMASETMPVTNAEAHGP
jgi:tetratricopeptide (TPR) repeat protein